MSTATVMTKGRITIPIAVRRALDLREHDKVVFVVEGNRALLIPVHRRELEADFQSGALDFG